jgi:hypothetical protein
MSRSGGHHDRRLGKLILSWSKGQTGLVWCEDLSPRSQQVGCEDRATLPAAIRNVLQQSSKWLKRGQSGSGRDLQRDLVTRDREAVAGQGRKSSAVGYSADLAGEEGLPDTALAANEQQGASALGGVFEVAVNLCQNVAPSREAWAIEVGNLGADSRAIG